VLACACDDISIHSETVSFKQLNRYFVHAADGAVIKFDRLTQDILHTLSKKTLLIVTL
jgi:hypothetical protein